MNDYQTLDGLFKDLATRTREAIANSDFAQVERLAAQMEAIGRCMDCHLRNHCPRTATELLDALDLALFALETTHADEHPTMITIRAILKKARGE